MNPSLPGPAVALYALTVFSAALALTWLVHSVHRSRRPASRTRGRRIAIPLYLAAMVAAAAALIIVLSQAVGAQPGGEGLPAIIALLRPQLAWIVWFTAALVVVAVVLHIVPRWAQVLVALVVLGSAAAFTFVLWVFVADPALRQESFEIRQSSVGVVQLRLPGRAVPLLDEGAFVATGLVDGCVEIEISYGVAESRGDWRDLDPTNSRWADGRLELTFMRTTVSPLYFWLPQRDLLRVTGAAPPDPSVTAARLAEFAAVRWIWARLLQYQVVAQVACRVLVPPPPHFLPLGSHRILIR